MKVKQRIEMNDLIIREGSAAKDLNTGRGGGRYKMQKVFQYDDGLCRAKDGWSQAGR